MSSRAATIEVAEKETGCAQAKQNWVMALLAQFLEVTE